MKKTLYFTSALLIFGLFVGCEKFELEDHCPEEDQQEAQFDPQDVRSTVNDDSDSEDDVKPGTRSLDGSDQNGIYDEAINKRESSDGSNDGNDNDEADDLINDDSDDEDEGEKPRSPGNSHSSPNGGR